MTPNVHVTKRTSPAKMMAVCTYEARKVALSPPTTVYHMTPIGMRKPASTLSMPDVADMQSAPPRMSIDVTRMLVQKAKKMNVKCAGLPQRTLTISRKVWQVGALRLTSIASTPKSSTWMDAPAAYQKGPEMPYCHATLDDWRRVAAHVHCETMTDAVRPVLTSRPAVLKCSEFEVTPVEMRDSIMVAMTVRTVKRTPKPKTMA